MFPSGLPSFSQKNTSQRTYPSQCVLLALLLALAVRAFAYDLPGGKGTLTRVPFRLVSNFAIIVPVYINGAGPYDFLLDTGTTITAIDRSSATKLHLTPVGNGVVASLVQKIPVQIGVAQTIRFGPTEVTNIEVLIRDLNGLRAADSSITGVLGQNALETVDFLIDYQHKYLQVDNDGALARSMGGIKHSIVRIPLPDKSGYSNPALCVDVLDSASCKRVLLLDSATASLVLFGSNGEFGTPTRRGLVRDAAGVNKPTAVYAVHLCLQELCQTLEAQRADFSDEDSRVQGLLPTNLFTKLYVSNKGGYVILNP